MLALNTVYNMDCVEGLANLDDGSINSCVTSPPYWSHRRYDIESIFGMEPTPQEYVANLVKVFRDVRRVLRDDGVLWLNLGDTYVGSWGNAGHRPELDGTPSHQRAKNTTYTKRKGWDNRRERPPSSYKLPGLKKKDLIGVPWRVALALQDDGWYLRNDCIWAKPNPASESVRDRMVRSHEYFFHLTKSRRYYFDTDAVKEPTADGTGTRYRRTVWQVGVNTRRSTHTAAFPDDLVTPCILSSCPEGGVVLDPFMGSGTVGRVAKKLNRQFVGFELNPDYYRECVAALTAV